MTILVYKGDTLAADRQITIGNFDKIRGEKIFREKDALIGFCGGVYAAQAFLQWWRKRAESKGLTYTESVQFSPDDPEDAFECIVITPHSSKSIEPLRIELWNGKLAPLDVSNEEYICLGSGMSVALGAIYMGATAKQAVEAAIKFDAACGFGVETVKATHYFANQRGKK